MVKMGMGKENLVDIAHFIQRQVAYASSRINQNVAIDQERCGSAVFGDRTGTAQHTNFHCATSFRFIVGCAVPFRIKWQHSHGGYTVRVQLVKVFLRISTG